jgi:menaquinol-cytochrome c reductase iron-sulfur subunit
MKRIEIGARSETRMDRRWFLETIALGGCAAALVGIPLASSFVAPSLRRNNGSWVDLGAATDLPADGFTLRRYELVEKDGWLVLPRRGFVWVRPEPRGGVRVLSATCTHLGCNVVWRPETRCFECPCHAGRFDDQGRPISGPPKAPLRVLPHKVDDGTLWVHLTA